MHSKFVGKNRATQLDTRQSDALDQLGYLVIPNVLDAATVARLCRAFDVTSVQVTGGTQHVEITPETPERETWAQLPKHPFILAAAEHILKRPHGVSALHGRNPLSGFGQQGLHTDWPNRAKGEPYAVVTSIWMLDDFTTSNGATRIVPGSHLSIAPIPKSYAQPLATHPNEVIVTGSAGSALIFNGHLWHSGTRNRTQSSRRAVQMTMLAVRNNHPLYASPAVEPG
jgi:ectoine hydroxylase-related dioxygenase (phytanoyl-CoA dioxygenase family)